MGTLEVLKDFDVYPKIVEDFRVRTISGGIKIHLFFHSESRPDFTIDPSLGEKLNISFDISFPKLACAYISLDTINVMGEFQSFVEDSVYKTRLDPEGNKLKYSPERHHINSEKRVNNSISVKKAGSDSVKCGNCYGAQDEEVPCCNSCDEIRMQYEKKGWKFASENITECSLNVLKDDLKQYYGEGCRVHGNISLNKVQGNLHISLGKSVEVSSFHFHDLSLFDFENYFDLSHKIHSLSFGEKYPGMVNPLNSVIKRALPIPGSALIYRYYIKLVPTLYKYSDGKFVKTNQYSVTEYERRVYMKLDNTLPGVYFIYDISPILLSFSEYNSTFTHLLISIFAIFGGVFSTATIIDTLIYQCLSRPYLNISK